MVEEEPGKGGGNSVQKLIILSTADWGHCTPKPALRMATAQTVEESGARGQLEAIMSLV